MSTLECQKPHCSKRGTEKYRGKHGNSLRLCERHYYNLVSRNSTHSIDTNSDIDPITPFWDDEIRISTMDTTRTFGIDGVEISVDRNDMTPEGHSKITDLEVD